jgi:CBS domain-containing protein
MKVKELMSEKVVAVGPETPLKDVAAILMEHRISGVPVVDAQREVIGIVSEADILVKEQGPECYHGGITGWLFGGGVVEDERLSARTAAEAMSSPAITIRAEKTVSEAARTMIESGIKRLPVVNGEGRLCGIVTRSDLVRAFARGDTEIEREIHDDVVRRTLMIDNRALNVLVHRGEVTLSGELERRSDAELLRRFVRRVPGVVTVRSTVTWEWDDRKALEHSDPRVPVA